jgi:hypothetical protein
MAILDARGIEVPEEVRADITKCTDLDRLEVLVRRAAIANTIEDLNDPNH